MKRKRWTFNGIKQKYPNLSFEDWLKICKKGQHYNYLAADVVEGFINQ